MKALLIARTEGTMAAVRQCTNGMSRIEHMKVMLPQRIEDGKFINCSGDPIGTWDGDDQEIFPLERLTEATRCTDALLNDVFKPINALLGTTNDRAETKAAAGDPEPEPKFDKKSAKKQKSEPEPGLDDVASIMAPIEKAIKKGKLKKAKSLLEAAKELIDDDDYKSVKKQIKKGAKNG